MNDKDQPNEKDVATDIAVVAENQTLYWPESLYPMPASWGNKKRGWLDYMRRHPELRVRGKAGYAVDMNALLERELFCKGQADAFERTSHKRRRIAASIEMPGAVDALERFKREVKALEQEQDEGEAVTASVVVQSIPEVEGAIFKPYTIEGIKSRWAGVYIDAGDEEAISLLPAGDNAKPLALAMVPEIERPVPLIPAE